MAARQVGKMNKQIVSENCTSFTNCIIEINNVQTNIIKDIDLVMPIYELIEYTDNYSKASGTLW